METQLLAQTFLTHLISAECCFPDPESQLRWNEGLSLME